MPVMDRFDPMAMLSGSAASQYLPPDYLQPLPTTLDAKNSPLALLAQTCSSIGKDPPSKQIIPNIEKRNSPDKPDDDGQNNNSAKNTTNKPKDGRLSTERVRPNSRESKEIHNFYPISTSSPKPEKVKEELKVKEERKSSDNDTRSVPSVSRPLSSSSSSHDVKSSSSERSSPRSKLIEQSKDRDNREIKYTPPLKRQRSESPVRREYSPAHESKHQHTMYPGLPYGALGLPPHAHGGLYPSAEAIAAAGYSFGLPGQNVYSGYNIASAHANALAAHQAALKSGSSAALSQYMQSQYARMKAPQGPSSVCKDPYCTNCVSAATQSPHLPSQCTSPGCAQCSHEKQLQALSHLGLPHGSNLPSPYNLPGAASASVGLSALHSLYAQNLLTQQQQQHQQQHGHPHVCNWMAGSEYCGKRFTTSEELLQHLRTHTSGGESALSAYYSLGLAIPPQGDVPGLPGYLSSSSNISPETLRRMYPTSLSPLSNRYHPYKSGHPSVPSGLPAHQSLSALAPYYSAYGLYGQRLGPAAVP